MIPYLSKERQECKRETEHPETTETETFLGTYVMKLSVFLNFICNIQSNHSCRPESCWMILIKDLSVTQVLYYDLANGRIEQAFSRPVPPV